MRAGGEGGRSAGFGLGGIGTRVGIEIGIGWAGRWGGVGMVGIG